MRFSALFRRALSVFTAVGWLAAAPMAQAQAQDGDLKSTLEGRYAQMKAVVDARDIPGLSAMLAPGFVSIDTSGQSQTAEQMTAELVTMPPHPERQAVTTLTAVTGEVGQATVQQAYESHWTRTGDDGAAHRIGYSARSTDIWVKVDDEWLMRSTITDETAVSIDGVVVNHSVREP